jgi:hypothetical protein
MALLKELETLMQGVPGGNPLLFTSSTADPQEVIPPSQDSVIGLWNTVKGPGNYADRITALGKLRTKLQEAAKIAEQLEKNPTELQEAAKIAEQQRKNPTDN